MKNIYISLLCCFAFLAGNNFVFGQACTTALQPMNVTATDLGMNAPGQPFPGQTGTVLVEWDPQCGARTDGSCDIGDDNSVFFYIGLYGQNAPAPNGIEVECGVSSITLDCSQQPVTSLVVTNGGDAYNGTCLDPKGSTCVSTEFSQMRPPAGGDITSWHAYGADAAGFLGYCETGGPLNVVLDVCPGQCYNVVVWELIIDEPSGTGPNADGGAGGTGTMLPIAGMDANISCPNINLVDESPASDVIQICIDAPDGTDNALIDNPTLTVTNSVNGDPAASICDALNGVGYTGTFQSQPEDIGDPTDPCVGQDVDACNSVNNVTDPLASDGTVDQVIGGTGNGGDAGGLAISFPGTDSANGQLGFGDHVVEVNCREDIGIIFSTPEGCKGYTDQNVFGLPACDFSDGTLQSTNAKVYITNNGMPISPIGDPTVYPQCYTGEPGSTNSCTTNAGAGYPNDYTAQFGNFVSSDAVNDPCITNLVGNPFEGSGINPFTLPGALSGIDFGDGVARDVSTICVKYEDPCDGSKSVTCIKFISDASPLDATIRACNETCPGASDGQIIIHDIAGGSDDPNSDSNYADGLSGAGSYELDIVAGPVTGQVFTYQGGSSWTATGLPPGVYTVDIRDGLASGDTFDADADDTNAMCGAACTIQRVVEILPGPVVSAAPAVMQGSCDAPGTATLTVDKLSRAGNGQVIAASGPGTVPGDFATESSSATTATSGLFAGCPDDLLGPASVVEICITNFVNTTNNSGADLAGTQIAISLNGSGPISFLSNGNAFGGGGNLSAGPVTMCYSAEAGAGAGPDGAGATFGAIFAGLAGNGISIALIASDGFGTGDSYAYDDITITINDQVCMTDSGITAFCGGMGPDEGDGAGNITSADQTITWTSADPNESAAEPFTFLTLAGPGENDLTFDTPAAVAAGLAPGSQVCYDAIAYVPGNEFNDVNNVIDNQGFSTVCYQGICCEVVSQVCFTIPPCFSCPDIADPTLASACSCDNAAPAAMVAAGMCDPSSPAVIESGVVDIAANNPVVAGVDNYFSQITVPAQTNADGTPCSITSAIATVNVANYAGADLFLDMENQGPNGGVATPFGPGTVPAGYMYEFVGGTGIFGGTTGQVLAGDVLGVFVFQNGQGNAGTDWMADVTVDWSITYDCPAPDPLFNFYGDATMAPLFTDGPSATGQGSFVPAAGMMDANGVAFDPAVCGTYTFCVTTVCNFFGDDGVTIVMCESDPVCADYTVNPAPIDVVPIDLGTVCSGGEMVIADLAGANGGGLDYEIYSDPAGTMGVATVVDGMFPVPDTAPGAYVYYYTGPAPTCDTPGYVEDPNCPCVTVPQPILLIIQTTPEAGTCDGPKFACAGNPDMLDLTLTATCAACPDIPTLLICDDSCPAAGDPCEANVTITQMMEGGVVAGDVDYEGDNAPYTVDIPIPFMADPAWPPCATATLNINDVAFTIAPFGGSWTNEASFDILDGTGASLIGGVQGPNLPGSASNNTAISGNTGAIAGTAVPASSLGGSITLAVFDNFNDGGVDGNFSAVIDYEIIVDIPMVSGVVAGPATPSASSSINWYFDAAGTMPATSSAGVFDPITDPNFDVNTPGDYVYYFSCTCDGCEGPISSCQITINEQPEPPMCGNNPTEFCEGADIPDFVFATSSTAGSSDFTIYDVAGTVLLGPTTASPTASFDIETALGGPNLAPGQYQFLVTETIAASGGLQCESAPAFCGFNIIPASDPSWERPHWRA